MEGPVLKKRLLLVFSLTALAIVWVSWPAEKPALVQAPQRVYPPAPNPRPKVNEIKKVSNRAPASVPHVGLPLPSLDQIKLDHAFPVGKNAHIVEDLAVTEIAHYKPELGKQVHNDGRFIFYRAAVTDAKTFPVAYDKVNRSLLPVTHFLHVKGADQALRASLLAEGFKEYYYQPKMKFLSLETSTSTVLQHYQDLKKRGYEVKLELVKPGLEAN